MSRRVIAIAGATGFVGRVLIRELQGEHHLIGLTRGTLPAQCSIHPGQPCPITWRQCDLYALSHCEEALREVDVAIYLVHSMLPSAKLTQGSFEDMDLIMADNFARAAAKNGVKRIIYLSGFVPAEKSLSRHIQSRLEVERVLDSHGVPLTSLRTGIIVGPGGSSTRMVIEMVRRLPLILAPAFANSRTQPIGLSDVVDIFRFLIDNPERYFGAYDIAGAEILTYRELIASAARIMKLRRTIVSMPLVGVSICKRLMAFCTSAPDALTSPLVESMQHSMVQRERRLQNAMGQQTKPLRDAFITALNEKPEGDLHRCCLPETKWRRLFSSSKVRSVQRIPLPPGKSTQWLAQEYAKFHHTIFRLLVRGDVKSSGSTTVRMRMFNLSLLELTYAPDRSNAESALFFITGGLLTRKPTDKERTQSDDTAPRLEFRRLMSGNFVIIALHDYVPSIPFPIYTRTQAVAHLLFMALFARQMRKLSL